MFTVVLSSYSSSFVSSNLSSTYKISRNNDGPENLRVLPSTYNLKKITQLSHDALVAPFSNDLRGDGAHNSQDIQAIY